MVAFIPLRDSHCAWTLRGCERPSYYSRHAIALSPSPSLFIFLFVEFCKFFHRQKKTLGTLFFPYGKLIYPMVLTFLNLPPRILSFYYYRRRGRRSKRYVKLRLSSSSIRFENDRVKCAMSRDPRILSSIVRRYWECVKKNFAFPRKEQKNQN